ncbi:ubiquitin-associated protein 1-like [Cynoglossus semilaevis]|uniref:Ubiquitin associated protein 1 like n=1 Tax=Cynoglossus semilaevis TaxID=244447 RepID=A0A3P8VDH3_CYNSE|nr:ubiquitin-associated protein 1-like [Cynoglossus semilaevis]
MDGVPLKMPQPVSQIVMDDVIITVPDYLTSLQETRYEFHLEKWVLTGLQSGFTSQQQPQPSSCSSGTQPSCPPYWMMFNSPQQSRLASRHSSDFWEPNPRQRSHSLNLSVLRTKFTISESEDEEDGTRSKAQTGVLETKPSDGERPSPSHHRGQQKAFVPDLLNPPACLSSLPHQRRKNLRQCSLNLQKTFTQRESEPGNHVQHLSSCRITQNSGISNTTTKAGAVMKLPTIISHNSMATLSPDSCRNPLLTSTHQGLRSSGSDSTAELLSALSSEENELLEAVTARGYPLRTAIIALQKTGTQMPEEILNYLVACDHLCQLGYDMVQVEEALEMFQNCETKAEEFLQLLSQFHEMGFQQNTIKEVLLVHENHKERALEELIARVA